MSNLVTIALALTVLAIVATVHLALVLYVLPGSDAQEDAAKRYRVPRRHLENVHQWAARTLAAARAVSEAERALMREAERLGWVSAVSGGMHWALPHSHPLSIALMVARYPDGPPADVLTHIFDGSPEADMAAFAAVIAKRGDA